MYARNRGWCIHQSKERDHILKVHIAFQMPPSTHHQVVGAPLPGHPPKCPTSYVLVESRTASGKAALSSSFQPQQYLLAFTGTCLHLLAFPSLATIARTTSALLASGSIRLIIHSFTQTNEMNKLRQLAPQPASQSASEGERIPQGCARWLSVPALGRRPVQSNLRSGRVRVGFFLGRWANINLETTRLSVRPARCRRGTREKEEGSLLRRGE